ncbi:MAG: PEP-utilizing enzyme [Candidatus Paceibacterota bacterium]|jgi:phosphoenolpyruvate synthase/pyruvate phosphate dikinase
MKNTVDFKPFSDNTEMFRWGPIPARLFYVSEFDNAIFNDFPKEYEGDIWPKSLLLFKDGKILWLNDFSELREIGRKIFIKYILNKEGRKVLMDRWKKDVKSLEKIEAKISKELLKRLNNKELYDISREFYDLVISFWLPTIPVELGNYGSDRLLEEKLKRYVKPEKELSSIMEILTTPEEPSFFQKEEIDLVKSKDIKEHTKDYFWLKNSYDGVEVLNESFFLDRKSKIDINIEKKTTERIIDAKNNKKRVVEKYKLSNEIVNIAEGLCDAIIWQDNRKKHVFVYLHYKELLLREVAERFNIDIDILKDYSAEEILSALQRQDFSTISHRREKAVGYFMNPSKKVLSTDESMLCWEKYAEEKISDNIQEIKGIVASTGKKPIVQGKIKIVLDPKDHLTVFNKGEILVAPMTSPEYIFLMKKSVAIVTDTGGLTSHAAIVSRELGIPCIVDTKIATKVLKDGDMVEVDANKGIIRIINK